MRDVLEDIRDLGLTQLRPKEIVVHLAQFRVREMVPPGPLCQLIRQKSSSDDSRAGITVQQGGRFDKLLALSTSLALVRVVRVTQRFGVELEQLA